MSLRLAARRLALPGKLPATKIQHTPSMVPVSIANFIFLQPDPFLELVLQHPSSRPTWDPRSNAVTSGLTMSSSRGPSSAATRTRMPRTRPTQSSTTPGCASSSSSASSPTRPRAASSRTRSKTPNPLFPLTPANPRPAPRPSFARPPTPP